MFAGLDTYTCDTQTKNVLKKEKEKEKKKEEEEEKNRTLLMRLRCLSRPQSNKNGTVPRLRLGFALIFPQRTGAYIDLDLPSILVLEKPDRNYANDME